MSTKGTWDPELFERFRAVRDAKSGPKAIRRRMLLGQLLAVNEPLIKVLVSQLCGLTPGRRLGGMIGAEKLEWEDAMQSGLLGFADALERFDPALGKISYYALHRIRYRLQTAVSRETELAYVPPQAERKARLAGVTLRPQVGLVAWDQTAEHLATVDAGVVDVEGLTPEIVERWAETGEWPEIEQWRPKVISIPAPVLSTLERFVRDRCRRVHSARTATADVWFDYRVFCDRAGVEAPPSAVAFTRELEAAAGIKPITFRDHGVQTRGIAGLRLQQAAGA